MKAKTEHYSETLCCCNPNMPTLQALLSSIYQTCKVDALGCEVRLHQLEASE